MSLEWVVDVFLEGTSFLTLLNETGGVLILENKIEWKKVSKNRELNEFEL